MAFASNLICGGRKKTWRDWEAWQPRRETGSWTWHMVKGAFVFSFPFCAEAVATRPPLESQSHQKTRWRVSLAHGRPARWIFLEPWGFSSRTLPSALKESFMWVQYGRRSCWKPRISTERRCAGCKIQGVVGMCRGQILPWLIQWVAEAVAWTWGIAGTIWNLAWEVDYKLRSRIVLSEKQTTNSAFILIGNFTCVLGWWSNCRAELITWIN